MIFRRCCISGALYGDNTGDALKGYQLVLDVRPILAGVFLAYLVGLDMKHVIHLHEVRAVPEALH